MVDSNHAYNFREAVQLSKKLEPLNISWFEEPLSPEFYHQYNELRQKTTIPIAGGECEYLRFGFHQLLENQSVDIQILGMKFIKLELSSKYKSLIPLIIGV